MVPLLFQHPRPVMVMLARGRDSCMDDENLGQRDLLYYRQSAGEVAAENVWRGSRF
jgi:hypothetical protein